MWLLDVDGVVNAVSDSYDPTVWPARSWIRTVANAAGDTYPILASRRVLDFLELVHDRGLAEIRWHTTWQEHAVTDLAPALGLPAFSVAWAPEYVGEATAAAGGSAPPSGVPWWKVGAAVRVVHAERRPLLWTDDELTRHQRRGELAGVVEGADVPIELIAPTQQAGMTRRHLRAVARFLNVEPDLVPPAGP